MQLRYYQQEMVDALIDFMQTKQGNPIVASPTGTGKSLAFNAYIKEVVTRWPGTRIMCLAHVKEIIEQNAKSMRRFWPEAPFGIYSASLKRKDTAQDILFTSIQSVAKGLEKFGTIHIVLIDEAHMVSPKEASNYDKLISKFREINPDLLVVGFSATPYRMGQGLLTEGTLFTDFCIDLTTTERFNQFVAEGHLCKLVTKGTKQTVDVSQLHIVRGDYDQTEMAGLFDTTEMNKAVVDEVIRYGADRKHWLGFAASVKHSENLVREFLSRGVTAISIDGSLKLEERERRFKAFESGEYRCMINCGICSTGYDFPALDLGFIARATQSTSWWIQALGRFLRIAPEKRDAIILDFCKNTARCGPVNAPVIPRKKQKGMSTGEAPVKECPVCSTYNHTRVSLCVECGYEFPPSSCLEKSASTMEVMVTEAEVPVFETCKVFQTVYAAHDSKPKVPGGECNQCVRVSYSLGITAVTQYHVFKNHPFFEGKIAKFWRTLRGHSPVPKTRDEFLQRTGELTSPKEITIISNKKYPEVTEIIMP